MQALDVCTRNKKYQNRRSCYIDWIEGWLKPDPWYTTTVIHNNSSFIDNSNTVAYKYSRNLTSIPTYNRNFNQR